MFRYQYNTQSAPSRDSNQEITPRLSREEAFERTASSLREDTIGSPNGPMHLRARIKSSFDQLSRSVIYADFTASGRSLESIESYVHERVLPWYGNTHTVASGTARQSTHFREEARHIIRNYFNCTEANAVIFTGSGVTAAVTKFIGIIEAGIREGSFGAQSGGYLRSHLVEDRWGSLMCSACNVRVKNEAMFRSHCSSVMHQAKLASADVSDSTSSKRVHFLIDSANHHSAMLPFRELARQHLSTITVESVHINDIATALQSLPDSTIPVAVMSAMSNVTGLGPSTDAIYAVNEAVHAKSGLVAWDLATYASHHRFDMNPVSRPRGYSDFTFVSSHKLIGGPGAAGLLLARREWLRNSTPTVAGGGVVFFASEKEESYIQNSEEREEAGTPDIIGCIRAGLVFALHSRVDMDLATARELGFGNYLKSRFSRNPNIILLGGTDSGPSSILSFNMTFGDNLLLHHNFVVTVLNDLFGIQARGGCACAGPLAQHLLGLNEGVTHRFHMCLQQSGQEIFRPGFVRLGVQWTMTQAEVDLIADAVEWIAMNGPQLLSVYSVDLETGEWNHRISNHDQERDWLTLIDFLPSAKKPGITSVGETIPLDKLVDAANAALARMHESVPLESVRPAVLDNRYTDLVWFALPMDSKILLTGAPVVARPDRIVHPTSQRTEEVPEDVEMKPDVVMAPVKTVKKDKKFAVPRKLRTLVTSAIIDYSMIKEGDRILIGVSGGKDSLSLLHVLLDCQRKCPFRFEIACATVDPQVPEYNPHALIAYMESLGVTYHYLSSPIMEIAKTAMTGKQSICSFCSRMKRGMLYGCMRENGYNVLALGQHLDDLVESFLMSCFRNGALRTMKANYAVKAKDLRVIRPLIYARERMTTEFANEAQLPIIRDNCPACFAAPKERHRVKMLLSNEEYQNNHLFASMLQSMKPLIGISSALSTRELIEGRMFPIGNLDEEEDDQGAEEMLLPCNDGSCPLPQRI